MIITSSTRTTILCTGLGLAMSLAGCECGDGDPQIGRLTAVFHSELDHLDFGEVPVGAKKELPLPIENRGQLPLFVCVEPPQEGKSPVLECMELSAFDPAGGPFSAKFESLEESGAWSVQTAGTREILVVFSPQTEGAAQGKYIIRHNGSNGPSFEVTLNGVGVRPQVDVAPQALDFGEVTVGQRKSMDLTLTNRTQFAQPVQLGPINQTSLIFGVLSASGAEAQPGDPLIVEVPGNNSITVQVWFGPQDAGQATNTLPVKYCPSGCDVAVTLLGQGVKPEFVVEPARLDFGRLPEGQASTLSFAVRNIGVSRLLVNTIDLEAGTSSEYMVVPQSPLPLELTPGGTLNVAVTYKGTTPGTDNGRIRVETTAWDNPGTPNDERIAFVELVAESVGPDIAALPGALNFGTLAVMTGMGTRNVILENQGNSALTISGIQLNTPTGELTLGAAPPTPAVLQPGDTVTVTVRYAPMDAGLDQAQLVVLSDDRDENPLIVEVAGVGGVPTTCALAVSPPNLNFGLVELSRTAVLPVDARNLGAQPCNLSSIATSGDAAFGVTNGVSAVIPPGATYRIEVGYTPPAHGMHSGQLTITSDDPAQPMINVPLVGSSAPVDLRVIPSDIDFATVPVTCGSVARTVTLYNTGTRAITVNRVYLDPSTTPEFELCVRGAGTFAWCMTPFSVPQSIPAGGNVAFQVRYRPADIGADSGVIFIESSATTVPVSVPLRGRGDLTPTVTDRFTQLPTPQADVLFVVDDSCSMSEEQSGLGRNLGAFLTYAQSAGVDYQIGVTTTDTDSGLRGAFTNRGGARIITPMTANAAQVFNTNVNMGTNGSSTERGLEAAYLALTDPAINNENRGFLRPSAALAVVVVSDEEDSSTRQLSFYENFFRNIKGFANSSMFSFSAIVTPSGGCSPGGASPGNRYIQIAQATGGVVESICTANWGNTLSNIGLNTFGLGSRFNLSAQPVPSTIAVTVNGAPVQAISGGQTQWRYDSATNSLNFQSGFVPQANAVIEVTYSVACLP